jgi:hypothetical protein
MLKQGEGSTLRQVKTCNCLITSPGGKPFLVRGRARSSETRDGELSREKTGLIEAVVIRIETTPT